MGSMVHAGDGEAGELWCIEPPFMFVLALVLGAGASAAHAPAGVWVCCVVIRWVFAALTGVGNFLETRGCCGAWYWLVAAEMCMIDLIRDGL